ncbi:MAG: preprotein translocase subunit YajC [Planctomycetota bacterium]|jgi:preprotein translocase subunit YajC
MHWIVLGQTPQGAGGLSQLLGAVLPPVVFMCAVFYFLLIRPQRKQEKQRKEMLKALQKNDKVVTIGGIHGVVANVRSQDNTVVLKVDESGKVRLKVSHSAISRLLSGEEQAEDKE